MARNYAALLHEYLEEMEDLSDAEFGRLCRSLLEYSMTGTCPALSGNERFYFKRVKMQEDRFRASYDEQAAKLSDRGKAGAHVRWSNAKDAKDAKACLSITSNAKNGNTETKTNIKTNSSPPYPPSWGEGLAAQMDAWLAYKAEKRQGYKPQGLKSLVSQVDGYVSKYGQERVIAVIQRSMAANYQGIVWDWLDRPSGRKNQKKQQSQDSVSAADTQTEDLRWLQEYMERREGGDEE